MNRIIVTHLLTYEQQVASFGKAGVNIELYYLSPKTSKTIYEKWVYLIPIFFDADDDTKPEEMDDFITAIHEEGIHIAETFLDNFESTDTTIVFCVESDRHHDFCTLLHDELQTTATTRNWEIVIEEWPDRMNRNTPDQ